MLPVMSRTLSILTAILFPALCFGQLSSDQRVQDFQDLAATFSKHYAFYEWKRDAVKFDGLDLTPWLARVRASKDDVEFWSICAQYVASYRDSHSAFQIPSDYAAKLGFSVDLYDDKVLVDSIDATAFKTKAPVQIGDELVALDGKLMTDLITDIASQVGDGNPISGRRFAASLVVSRRQDLYPRAYQISDKASLLIHRRDGSTDTVVLPWIVTASPYTLAGPVPTPRTASAAPIETGSSLAGQLAAAQDGDGAPRWPAYMHHARQRQQLQLAAHRFIAGFGDLQPVFDMPAGFLQRRGLSSLDTLFTGTFPAGALTVGFLRIADFSFISTSELQREMAFFEADTDGIVVDMSRNPGGSGCQAEKLASAFAPKGLQSLAISARATWNDVLLLTEDLTSARDGGATPEDIAELQLLLAAYKDAFQKNRGLTSPLPLCSNSQDLAPLKDRSGQNIAYDKPVLLLVDGFTASAAELFSAILQDNGRALVYGATTDGAGGAVSSFDAGTYGETFLSLAHGILVRKQPIAGTEFPAAPYIENIGVRPDVVANYNTADNLLNRGKPFVDALTAKMVDYIQSKKQ